MQPFAHMRSLFVGMFYNSLLYQELFGSFGWQAACGKSTNESLEGGDRSVFSAYPKVATDLSVIYWGQGYSG